MRMVALRKESVDRNRAYTMTTIICIVSLSARRAWIEISTVIVILRKRNTVALRKESVDRNSSGAKADSPTQVALRKESVDRNYWWVEGDRFFYCRSPQGERG